METDYEYITPLPNDNKFDYFLFFKHKDNFIDIWYKDADTKDFIKNKIKGRKYNKNNDTEELSVRELLNIYPVVRRKIKQYLEN